MDVHSLGVACKVSAVTGSTKGIGRAIALALDNAGAGVGVTSRTLPDAEAVGREVENLGRQSLTCELVVRSLPSIEAMVHTALERFGRIDILVNNAGINIPQPALEVTEETWDAVLNTNLKGLFFCSQAVGRTMIERGQGGKIINIASQMGLVGGRLRSAYCARKGGVVQVTKVLAIEWAPHRINVNAVAPTFIRTPLTEPMFEDKAFYQDVVRRIPWGEVGEPEDVAGAVIYLASPASDLVTGHTLLVDGGWVAW